MNIQYKILNISDKLNGLLSIFTCLERQMIVVFLGQGMDNCNVIGKMLQLFWEYW